MKARRRSAAFRLAAPATLAFAVGSAVALGVAFEITAGTVRHHRDEVLTRVAADLAADAPLVPAGDLARWLDAERSELVRTLDAHGGGTAPVVLLVLLGEGGEPIAWSGLADPRTLLAPLAAAGVPSGRPVTLRLAGRPSPLRAVRRGAAGAAGAAAALSDPQGERLVRQIGLTLAALWGAIVAIGTAISWWRVRGVLSRVERLSRRAAAITDPEGGHRLEDEGSGDEISELAATLNAMLDRIATTVGEIRALSGSLAHDLRSPVTVIRGQLELALTREPGTDWQGSVAEAIEGLDRLAAMLEAILDVAEAEGGALALRRVPLDLSAMVREMVELYAPAAQEVGVELTAEAPPALALEADPHLLRRALSNLLDNALQHMESGSRVRVTATIGEAGEAVLAVEDDGRGFPPALARRAFDRSSRRPGSTGFGLGLALVRAVARAHGGDATLGAGRWGGAAITLRLPTASPEAGGDGGDEAA